MKRITLVISLVAVLAAIGIGVTFASAPPSSPVGNKLVGFQSMGYPVFPTPSMLKWSWFEITNPDCLNDITVHGVSIIRDDGEVIYDGEFYQVILDENGAIIDRVPVKRLAPHQVGTLLLHYSVPGEEPGTWLTPAEALQLPFAYYTVEFHWSTKQNGLPPIGMSSVAVNTYRSDGTVSNARTCVEMVNVKQMP